MAITGQGCIDGNGEYWRPLKKQKVTAAQWKQITSRGGAFKRADYWFPTEGALKADNSANMNVPKTPASEEEWNEIKRFLRPVMISLVSCKNVWLNGVIFELSCMEHSSADVRERSYRRCIGSQPFIRP